MTAIDRRTVAGKQIFMVGIKGAGMTALAELLTHFGAHVSGSDTDELFYTDEILARLGIEVISSFDKQWLPADATLVIYSTAYSSEHPQLMAAAQLGLKLLSYPEAIGVLSATRYAIAVAGVHGKTTTTAMAGSLVRALGLPGMVLVGGAVADFDGMSSWAGGDHFLIAETCEYQRHFLSYYPDVVVMTSVEADHLDYYRDAADIEQAFKELALRLPPHGTLLYCADNLGAARVATQVATKRADIACVPYGTQASGRWAVQQITEQPGSCEFQLTIAPHPFRLHIPGLHNVLNATAALAALDTMGVLGEGTGTADADIADAGIADTARQALARFGGVRRRCEVVGETNGTLILDDYAHHPTAIRATLKGLRSFYSGRRLIVDFMSHTYSRTAALLDEFASAFAEADVLYLHEIYASAREQYDGTVSGASLATTIAQQHPDVRYFPQPLDALADCRALFRPGDVFITMGAGDNWRLGQQLLKLSSAVVT